MAADIPARTPAPQPWPWPDSLDALIAAPAHHHRLLENELVRVLETRIPAGDTVPLHTHRWPAVFHVLNSSDFVRRDGEGNVLVDTRANPSPAPAPQIVWSEALPPHTLENVGQREIHLISIELKNAGS
jgi:quercetin dioxygenase-like cupin family protein